MVLFSPLAVLNDGLAEYGRRGLSEILPDIDTGYGIRHHRLLGITDDLPIVWIHGTTSIPRRLDPRIDSWFGRTQNVEIARKWDWSDGCHRKIRCWFTALVLNDWIDTRQRPPLLLGKDRSNVELLKQTMERKPFCLDEHGRSNVWSDWFDRRKITRR